MSGPPAPPARRREVEFRIQGMDCSACAAGIRRRVEGLDGVLATDGSPVGRRLVVEYDESRIGAETIRREIAELGYAALPATGRGAPGHPSPWCGALARRMYASALLLLLGLLAGWAADASPPAVRSFFPPPGAPGWLLLAAAAAGGWNFAPKAARALRRRVLDVNVLMTVAILGAVALGEYVEAAAIAALFSLAELLERHAVERARSSVRALMEFSPDLARVVRAEGETVVPATDVHPGDEVVVRPGERIPVDGEVVAGRSAVDEAAILGESMPREKAPGAMVFAGSFVHEGVLRVRSARETSDTTLARMVRLIEEAERRRSPSERFVERFARIYTPAVVLAALGVVLVPVALLGLPLETWLLRGLTLLVIACPCALVISTPVAVVSGLTGAARNGVLIKGGHALEAMGDVRVVAFDKTGTLTHGRAEVVEVVALAEPDPERVLRWAAAAEVGSEHPLGRAIVRAARRRGFTADPGATDGFRALPGRGVSARVDGREVTVGGLDLLGAAPPESVRALARAGRSPVVVLLDGIPAGVVALEDSPRTDAVAVVRGLRRRGVSRVVMLTGDHPEAASSVARRTGVDEVRAGLRPEEKVAAVRELEREHGAVAMVGDGVNDAPALAVATVGIAMGAAGSDAALETADVALLGDDLTRLPYAYDLARRSRAVIRQNVAASILVKTALAVGVPLGAVSLITAVLVGDLGASLGVTLNAMRLARRHP